MDAPSAESRSRRSERACATARLYPVLLLLLELPPSPQPRSGRGMAMTHKNEKHEERHDPICDIPARPAELHADGPGRDSTTTGVVHPPV